MPRPVPPQVSAPNPGSRADGVGVGGCDCPAPRRTPAAAAIGTLRLCLPGLLKSASSLSSSHTEGSAAFFCFTGGEEGDSGRQEGPLL